MSANAPAGRITRNTGNMVAACTSPTIKGDIVSCVISQPAPTFCIHVPVYEMTAATHSERNSGSRNGSHGDPLTRPGRPGTGVLTESAIRKPVLQRVREGLDETATRGCGVPAPYIRAARRPGLRQRSGSPLENSYVPAQCKQIRKWPTTRAKDRATCETAAAYLVCENEAQ